MFKRSLSTVIRSSQVVGKRVPLFVLQKRNVSSEKVTPITADKVIIENGRITTEQFLEGLRKKLGEPAQYTSKYPGETMEDFENFLSEYYTNRNFYITDEFKDFVREELHYSRQEIQERLTGSFGDFKMKRPDGLEIPTFQPVLDVIGISPIWNSLVIRTEKEFSDFLERIDNPVSDTSYEVDWAEAEKKLGKQQASQLRADAEAVKTMFQPELDLARIEKEIRGYIEPHLERFKDSILSDKEEIKEISDALVREAPLLETDEFGLEKHDFGSFEFMVTYYPKELDEIFVEIDNLNFDIEYKEEMKQLSIQTPERLHKASQKDQFVDAINETVDDAIDALGGTSILDFQEKTETPEQIARQKLFHEVNEIARHNKELELEIGQLKMRLQKDVGGGVQEGVEKGSKKKQQLEVSQELMDALIKLLGGDPSKKRVRVKDWKHIAPVYEEIESPKLEEKQPTKKASSGKEEKPKTEKKSKKEKVEEETEE